MKEYQNRVISERHDLLGKLDKLGAFIGGDVFNTLAEPEQQLLLAQAHAMRVYVFILNQRIDYFG